MHHSASKNGRGKPPGSLADRRCLGCNGLNEAAALRKIIISGLAHGWATYPPSTKLQVPSREPPLSKFVGPACPSRPIQRVPLGKWGFELMLFGNSGAACP